MQPVQPRESLEVQRQRQEVVQAEFAQQQATSTLASVSAQLRKEYLQSAEYREATVSLMEAQMNYQVAVSAVMATLAKRPDYQTLSASRDQIAKELDRARKSRSVNQGKITNLAKQALAISSARTKLECQELNASEEVRQAKQQMTDAGTALKAIRNRGENSVRSASAFIEAQRAAAEASARVTEARLELERVRRAVNGRVS